jgi:ribosomal protein S18 acetylase RimI-like enzyme
MCNFAADLDLDPWSARKLLELAQSRPAFHVYGTAGDRPEHLAELLSRAGFRSSYQMIQMGREPDEPAEQIGDLEEATSPESRLLVTRFMSAIFFNRQPRKIRDEIAETTARAQGLRLFSTCQRGNLSAAFMLGESPGMMGLYNLCVIPSLQGKGLGAKMVEALLSYSASQQTAVTLQCESGLVPFYEKFGFREIGRVDVYTIA